MRMTVGLKGRALYSLLLTAAIALFLAAPLPAKEAEVRGQGRSRQEAINNGLQAAVEQILGTLVKSQTEVRDGKLIWDKIASASSGYVRGYDVISEREDPSQGIYEVVLTVRVDDPKLQKTVDELMKDPNFMRLIQETKLDHKKVVVLYVARTKFDLPYDSKGVQTVMSAIQDRLAGHQFRVFLQEQLVKIHGRMAEKIVDEETAIDLVRRDKGDVAVLVSYDGAVRDTADGYKLITCTLSLKAYDLSTGQFFASSQERGKTVSRSGEYGIEDGVERIALKISPQGADAITRKIIERLPVQPKFHVIALANVSEDNQRAVQETLQNIGWRYRIASKTRTYLELEVFAEADPTTVQNTLDKAFREASLPLTPGGMAGSRIEFQGKARGVP